MEQEKHYFKRSMSLFLSLVMIMSVFTGLNISVSADDEELIDIDIFRTQCILGIADDPKNTNTIAECNKIYECYVTEEAFSPTKSFLDNCYSDAALMADYNEWKTYSALGSVSSIVDEQLKKEQYYEALIIAIYSNSVGDEHISGEDNEFEELLKNKALNNSITLTSTFCDTYGVAKDAKMLGISDAKNKSKTTLQKVFSNETAGTVLEIFDILIDMGLTVSECFERASAYGEMVNLDDETKIWLNSMYNACGDGYDEKLSLALNNLCNASTDFKGAAKAAITSSAFTISAWGIGECYDAGLCALAATNPLSAAVLTGLKAGKAVSNILFGTDDMCEKIYMLECLYSIEDLAKDVLINSKNIFLNSQTSANAKNFIFALERYFEAIINTDVDCMLEFLDELYNGGWDFTKNGIKWLYGALDDYDYAVETLEEFRKVRQDNYKYMFNAYIVALHVYHRSTYEAFYSDSTASADDFEYTVNNGEVTITKYIGGDTEVIIPSEIDGYPVTNIGNYAFYGCESLYLIIIPDSVTSIGTWVFADCFSLTSITIPEGVTCIKDDMFASCCSLTSIIIPESVTSIGYAAFYGCESLTSITIPDSVTSIGGAAFYGCESLTSITIPDNVTSIGENAFALCESLTSVIIGNSVMSIGRKAFAECYSLTSVIIPDCVTSIGDYAFQWCESLTSITIPDSVTSIVEGMFACCYSLTSIIIPDSVTSIGYKAFYNCKSLTTATIPDSVTSIDWGAFNGCDELTDVYYAGTEKQWNNILISGDNDCLLNATIHYSDTPQHKHTIVKDNAISPTCTKTGLTEGSHCSVCGEVVKEQEVIPATGHTITVNIALSPTCTKTGLTEGSHCSVCNEVIVPQEVVPATGHTYENGECVDCGNWQYKNTTVTLKSVKNTTSGVNISWTALAGADKYVVYRKTTGGWTKLTDSATGTSYTDKTAKNNVKYTYTVRAINGTEYNTTYNKTGLKITFMSAPKISKVENTASGVKVTWGKVSGATSYNVYRKTTGGWTKVGSTKSTSFTDTKAKAGTKYTYTIIAVKSGANNSSYYSGKAIVRLTVPKLTKLTVAKGKNTLTFGKVTGATSYIIYRKTGNGSWQRIATTKSTKYVDTKIKKGTYYTYTVRAVNGSSTSYYNTKGLKVKAK